MSIKQNGGVFGRNPTFNDVTIEGDLIINGEVFTGLDFQGSWNASTNTPALASSTGTNGEFYIVSVAGTTDLNGITNWGIGDWAIFNGTAWQRVEGGADGNFNDLTVAGSLSLGDNVKANFGAGDDLQIYYDGSHSWIKDAGAGNIYISSDGYAVNIVKGENTASVASFIPDGPVNLYNAGDLRLATTSTGIDVTGTATMDVLDASGTGVHDLQRSHPTTTASLAVLDLKAKSTGDMAAGFGAAARFIIEDTANVENVVAEIAARRESSDLTAALTFAVASAERMRIDSVGNLLVGKTAPTISTTGVELRPNGQVFATQSGNYSLLLNRTTSDGAIAEFRKDSSTVGRIGAIDGNIYLASATRSIVIDGVVVKAGYSTGNNADNAQDLGSSSVRWRDLYLSSGVYLGGTGTANKLDDYEEGTWTPALSFSGGSVGMTYSVQVGKYTKVGDMVTVSCQVTLSAKGSSTGIVKLTGLPFTASSDTNSWTPLSLQLGLVTFADFPQGYVRVGETAVSLNEITNSGYETTLGDTNFVDTSTVRISATYRV